MALGNCNRPIRFMCGGLPIFMLCAACWTAPGGLSSAGEVGQSESASPDRTRRLQRDNVTLAHSPESQNFADDLLKYAATCNEHLAKWFEPEAPVRQTVHWLSKRDWRKNVETYGFPYASGSDAYVAAADLDLPTQLTLIVDSMSIFEGGPAIERMARLARLPKGAGPKEVYAHLKQSREFFVVFTAYFILPHELTHGFCNQLDYPRQPRWYYEGIAQWAAYNLHKKLRSADEAEMIYQYYQLLWERGGGDIKVRSFARADELGAGGLDTPNYAWYHAGLLRMFRELEEMRGEDLLPDLIHAIHEKRHGRGSVSNGEMIATFSQVVGRDLRTWFSGRWSLGERNLH